MPGSLLVVMLAEALPFLALSSVAVR